MMDCCKVRHVSRFCIPFWIGLVAFAAEPAPLVGAAGLLQTLDRLNTLGSVLMVAAHPDDENTAVIAYFARGRHLRTAYLSATRGEGGQNLIGTEQYEALGLIRTQELLAARRIDGGEQFFTRAFDFGFTKSPEEALAKWGRDLVLADLVRVVRTFRPDVIVTRWSPAGGSGHGQHRAVGHLTPEVFTAAADPSRFPDQIAQGLQPWRARRLIWVTSAFNGETEAGARRASTTMAVDAGQFDFVLGKSYAEIAAESRSRHASQGFGTAGPKGRNRQTFQFVAGDPPSGSDPLDGIDTTWKRVPGAERLGGLLRRARTECDPSRPDRLLPLLLDAWREMQKLRGPWIEIQRPELLHAIELASGLQLSADAGRWDLTPGSDAVVTLAVVQHSAAPLVWESAEITGAASAAWNGGRALTTGNVERARLELSIAQAAPYSHPYWLAEPRSGDAYQVRRPGWIGLPENPPLLTAVFRLRAAPDLLLPFRVPVQYRWVDRARGELTRAVEIVPPVSAAFTQSVLIFPEPKARPLLVRVASHAGAVRGAVTLDLPAGWKADPPSAPFDLPARDREATARFLVTPPQTASGGQVAARAEFGGLAVSLGLVSILHPHIPPQVYFPPARARVERLDVRLSARNIGYVMGAGDEVPQALEQLGASVRLLSAEDLAAADLSRFDAIVTGVRALNVRDDLLAARSRLLDYVSAGGVLVVQYNTDPGSPRVTALAPYPLKPSSNRVTVEDAPVTFPHPGLPVLHRPNELTPRDFDGWVQERGLYFMADWDRRYQPVFSCHDPGEEPQLGGTLYAEYGKGVYIYTAYSWFRELPAGVPGAYRIFANLVSGGR